jgi:hypothetical protein
MSLHEWGTRHPADVMKNSSGAHTRMHPSVEDRRVGENFQVQLKLFNK